MKPNIIVTTFIIILLVGSVVACSSGEEATVEPIADQAIQQPNVVSAEAFVVPQQQADLAFEVGGRVTAVEVEEGDAVTEGQTLARLDDATQQAALIEAEAGLVSAQAALAQAQATLADTETGATPEEIAQAEAALARVEAALAESVAGPTEEDIAQAEARIETAQANLGCSALDIHQAVITEVQQFVGDAPQFDDITLMVLARDSEWR